MIEINKKKRKYNDLEWDRVSIFRLTLFNLFGFTLFNFFGMGWVEIKHEMI